MIVCEYKATVKSATARLWQFNCVFRNVAPVALQYCWMLTCIISSYSMLFWCVWMLKQAMIRKETHALLHDVAVTCSSGHWVCAGT